MMRPVLFSLFGIPVQSYGVSKMLAALVAGWLLARLFAGRGWARDDAYSLVLAGTFWGFVGAKTYYLLEHVHTLTLHDFGGMGFTWYGGFLGGVAAVVILAQHKGLPLVEVVALSAAPLSVAYGIGRLGCLLSGDGTYGKPSDLPWAMAFPDGIVPTTVRVQPTPLYEAIMAFALAGLLWWAQERWHPLGVIGAYLIGSGVARIAVESVRTNRPALWGMTQPQLWSIALLAVGVVLLLRMRRQNAVVTESPAGRPTGCSERATTSWPPTSRSRPAWSPVGGARGGPRT
jgi:phosphatidylglycerol:prolipoprotein diacylglycerol transferase